MNELIICPICGKKLKALGTHWVVAHKDISYYEYLKEHPDVKTITDDLKSKRAKHVINQRKDPKFVKAQSEGVSKYLTNRHANDKDFRESSIRNLRTDRSHSYGVLCKHTLYNGSEVNLRSKLEKLVATKLDNLNIEYTYEDRLNIIYSYKNKEHEYIPDFKIANTNILIEVKPEWFHNDPLVILKKESAESHGYEVWMIGYKTDIHKLISSSTTIEKLG